MPSNLNTLVLGNTFNKPIYDLPNSLKHLTLEGIFNKPISRFPLNIETINIIKCKYKEKLEENIIDIKPYKCEIIK